MAQKFNMPGLESYLSTKRPRADMIQVSSLDQEMIDNLIQAERMKADAEQAARPKVDLMQSLSQPVTAPATTSSVINPAEEAAQRAARARYESLIRQSIDQEKEGLTGLQQGREKVASAGNVITNTDWSPLMSWFDAGLGTQTAQTYKKPPTAEEREAMLLGIDQAIQKQKGGITDKEIMATKVLLDDYNTQSLAKQSRFEQAQDARLFDKARGEQSKLIKDATEFKGSVANVEDALRPDAKGQVSVGRVQQSLSQFSRLMGEKGVLTDTDIGRQLAPTIQTQLAKYEALLASNPNAKVDASVVQVMRDAIQAAKVAFKESYKIKADAFTQGYFQNPGSPYVGKPWAPKLVEDTYKPLELLGGQAQTSEDPALKRLRELRAKAGK